MTEKELLHKRERKTRRRRERSRIPKNANKTERRRMIFTFAERQIEKEIDRLKRVEFGVKQLNRLGEPLIEESKQREIERNIVD